MIQNSFTVASSFPVGSPERLAVDQSYTGVTRTLLIAPESFLTLTLLAALAIENIDLNREDREKTQAPSLRILKFLKGFNGGRRLYRPESQQVYCITTQATQLAIF